MKRFFLTFFILVSAYTLVLGKQIDLQTAQTVAQTFLSGNTTLRSTSSLELVYTCKGQSLSRSGQPENYYYVFNIGNNQGFIIISADDVNVPIIGYSTSGNYTPNDLPPNFEGWMNKVAAATKQGISKNATAEENTVQQWTDYKSGKLPISLRAATSVEPLTKTKWSQRSPYNDAIPFKDNGVTPPTGCVATAMAQVMKYYNHPRSGIKATEAYTTSTNKFSVPSIDLTKVIYNWANMLNTYTYNGTSTAAQKSEVAKLMYHVGASLRMNYKAGGSGASSYYISKALVQYFNYHPSAQYISKGTTSSTEWKNMIKEELTAGRPVLYDGTGADGGHEFICDGYNTNGYFSFNWGWGGHADGYYNIDALINVAGYDFSQDQGMVIGIKPNTGNPIPYLRLSYAIAPPVTSLKAGETFNLSMFVDNEGNAAFEGYCTVALTDANGNMRYILTQEEANTLTSIDIDNHIYKRYSCLIPANATSGTYYLRIMQKAKGTSVWKSIDEGTAPTSVQFTVTDATCTTPSGLSTTDITNDKATVKWNAVSGAQSYTLQYKKVSASTWTTASSSLTTTSFNLTGLSASTAYHWQVKANCSSTNSSAYTSALNFTTTAAVATCVNNYEPNESIATAYTINPNQTYNAGIGSPTDKDYYKFSLTGTSNVTVTLENLPKDYELKVYDSSNNQIGTSTIGGTDNELIILNNLSAGTYYVYVYGYSGCYDLQNCYNLKVAASAATATCVNNYEPNESIATAYTINPNQTYNAGIGSPTDKDYYKFSLTGTSNVTVTLENLPKDYELKVYNSSNNQIGTSTIGGTDNESITLNNLSAGIYYVYVYGYSGCYDLQNCYDLKVAASAAMATCVNNYEPNESIATAYTINPNQTYNAGIGSPTDKDYYKFSLTGTSNVTVTLENLPKDYELKVYDSSNNQIGTSTIGGTDNELIILNNLSAGTYYVYVYGYSGCYDLQNCYDLKVAASAATATCVNNYEPNESIATAYTINPNQTYNAGIGSSTDKDYYKFSLTGTSNVTVTLENLPKDYELKVYDSSNNQIGTSTIGGTANESITLNNLSAGTYYVYVYGFGGCYDLQNCYDLKVAASAATATCVNNYEPNESIATAYTINPNQTYNAGIGSSTDKDYYKFSLTGTSNVTVTLENLPKDYELKVYNSSNSLIAASVKGGTANESITLNNLSAGTYYVYVYGYSGCYDLQNCYTLKVAASAATRSIVENIESETQELEIQVYPNPVSDILNIKTGDVSIKRIILTDMSGRTVLNQKQDSNSAEIYVRDIATGTYILTIETDKGIISKRIQKK